MKRVNFVFSTLTIIAIVIFLSFQQTLAKEKKKEAPLQVLITNVNVWDGTSETLNILSLFRCAIFFRKTFSIP